MKSITIEVIVNAPLENVWEFWIKPEHIVHWAFASHEWEAPAAENSQGLNSITVGLFASVDFDISDLAKLMTELFPDPHLPYSAITRLSTPFHSTIDLARLVEKSDRLSRSSFLSSIGLSFTNIKL